MIRRVLVGVLRGGSLISNASVLRTSYRTWNAPECQNFNYGFRLVVRRET